MKRIIIALTSLSSLLLAVHESAADVPMVAVVYSKYDSGTDRQYDSVLAALHWPNHKWENVDVGQLATNLDRYDMLLFFNLSNVTNPRDFKPYRVQWLRFLKRGGVIFADGIQEATSNFDWIAQLGPDFRFVLKTFRAFQKSNDWTNPKAELNFGKVGAKWAEFANWSDKWTVINRNGNGQPIVMYQKVGKGLIVVSTSYGGETAYRTANLRKVWEFARKSVVPSPLRIKNASWGKGHFGKNKMDLTLQNTSPSAVSVSILSKTFHEAAGADTDIYKVKIASGKEKTLPISYNLGDGTNKVSLVLKADKGYQIYARTGRYYKLLNLGGAMKILDKQIIAAKAILNKLNDWPKQILEPVRQEYRGFAAASAALKTELKTENTDLRQACYEKIVEATARVKLLTAKAVTWQKLRISPKPNQKFTVTTSSSLQKVFRNRAWSSSVSTELRLELAANEHENVQVVIIPLAGGLNDVQVNCSELKSSKGSIRDIQVRPVADVYLPSKGDWYPDVLLTVDTFDMPADRIAQGVWITVHTEPDTPAATYSGTVTVKATGSETINLPITVKVWDFAVPHKRNLPTEFSLRPHQLARFYFGQKAFYGFSKYLPAPTYRQLLEYLLKYRIAPYPYSAGAGESASMLGYLGEQRKKDYTVIKLDFTEYDKNTQLMLDYGVDMVCAGILFSPPEEYYKSFLPKMYEHLREKGWDKKAFIYGRDEFPVKMQAQIRKNYAWIKETAPTFRHLIPIHDADNLPEANDPGFLDIWVPTLSLYSQKFAAERAKYGQSVWAYIVNSSDASFDVSRSTSLYRSLFWNIWRRRCAGFLYYCTAFFYWEPSPADFNADGSPKKTFIHGRGNSMDFLCYPAGAKPEDGLNASIRLETIRDGLEDWEYLYILKNLIANHKSKSSKLVKAAEQFLQQIDSGTAKGGLLVRRRAVAQMIERLSSN